MVTATTSSAAEHSGGARAFRVTQKRVDRHRWRPCWLPHCVAISCRESLFPLSALRVEQGNTGPPTHCTKASKITSVARQLGSGNSELISRFEWETQYAARCHTGGPSQLAEKLGEKHFVPRFRGLLRAPILWHKRITDWTPVHLFA